MFTLRLRRFWPGADKPGGFFPRLVQQAIGEPVSVITSVDRPADLEIVEGSPRLREVLVRRARMKVLGPRGIDPRWAEQECVEPMSPTSIWYTAENVRPPTRGDWSGFLSFDLDTLGGRNAYLPLWMLDLRDFNTSGDLTLNDLLEYRQGELDRPQFACAFIGNPDPMRFHAIDALSAIGPVDVYGHAVGRPVPNKWAIASQYRYIISFENDLYPGYVTEKVLDGARSGCILLYRGLHSPSGLSSAAMVNWIPPLTMSDFVGTVAMLELEPGQRDTLLRAPVLRSAPNMDDVLDLIRRVLDD